MTSRHVDLELPNDDDAMTRVERNASRVLRLVTATSVERTRDVVQIDVGDERGIVIVVTPDTIELRLPTVEWTRGAYGPRPSSRPWTCLDPDQLDDSELLASIDQARTAREAEFTVCRYCGLSFPPEHRIAEDVCHGCASAQEGVVF